jgi:hypothetical protein
VEGDVTLGQDGRDAQNEKGTGGPVCHRSQIRVTLLDNLMPQSKYGGGFRETAGLISLE